jgi:predicted nucleotidyltransferase
MSSIKNRDDIIHVAKALEGGVDEMIFVGASVMSLYVTQSGSSYVRQTFDVDVVLHMASKLNAESIRRLLITRGFKQSSEDSVICRFRLNDIIVDVLSTVENGWIPSNRWFLPGLEHAIEVDCEGTRIKILSLPYFIAAKWDAFQSRGGGDTRRGLGVFSC